MQDSGTKKKIAKRVLTITLGALFAYGLLLFVGFFAIKYGITNTKGGVDSNSSVFNESASRLSYVLEAQAGANSLVGSTIGKLKPDDAKPSGFDELKSRNACKLNVISGLSFSNAGKISETYQDTKSDVLASKMLLAVSLRLKNDSDFENRISSCDQPDGAASQQVLGASFPVENNPNAFTWANEDEWKTIRDSVIKDKDKIDKAAEIAGIEPRLIVSNLIVEQLRLFHSDRELFKKVFEPLKILSNATQISLGVMGVKEKTAIDTENHLKDPSSPYYLGSRYEHVLDFATGDIPKERFDRLTNDKDHYYSYLYAAMYLKEIMTQWKNAGYDIQYRPEIVGTLFNVGFSQSKPKPDPQVGGSKITIGDGDYSFGSLAYEFYYSGELSDDFPYVIK
ncbi:MAG: hypothetical protein HGB08_02550 [Candidatus Moranbacteria bacterium]|nr:hypothetical protein [Candidatus Moranbacteria bacterium]